MSLLKPNVSDNYNKTHIKLYTLVFVKEENRILLGMKRRGFGVGKWNGFGGKVESNETIEQSAIRELKEESEITIRKEDLNRLGYVVYFDSNSIRLVYIFTAIVNQSKFKDTEEMLPKWFDFNEIPFDKMWPDSQLWMDYVLKDTKLKAFFYFGPNGEILYEDVNEIIL